MNKSETKAVDNLGVYIAWGVDDAAARGLSALIRAARTNKSREALMEVAKGWDLINHPDFII